MSAHVRDVTAIRDFRAALIRFSEEVASVLDAIQVDLLRSIDWIEHDRPQYWAIQTRKGFDAVAQTRTALNTCQLRTVAGRRPACIEEKVAFEKAKRRLQHCHDQIERIRRWSTRLNHEADEFRGRLAPLQRLLDGDSPRMLALLDRMASSLEDYADILPAGLESPGGPPDSVQETSS